MQTLEPLVFQLWWVAAIVLCIVVVGSIVQAGLGMGFGLTVAPLLALIDPIMVPVPALFMGAATAILGAYSEHEKIVWKEVGIGMIGRLTGILFGLFILVNMVSRDMFSLVFGIIILGAVILSVAGWSLAFNMRNLLSMGIVSGFTGIITSVGAPPLALIYQHRTADQSRATLAAFFAFGGVTSLIILYAVGYGRVDHFWLALFMAPAAFIGTWFGRRLKGKFDARYRSFLLAIAGFAALLLIIRGLGLFA